ncbi:serine hydrolase domain-containing protein [Paenibacillus pabuli]|uniref:serine hydrolase domain-containing protein n=1 Tax=Paenibacillus pabuli TaxID=1472 RepID=UPI0007829981|nr:serine hydrolase domain-containing protein [Paenibacillus pabuli]MEC0128940.1 serine hydrolase [Paenibacillus pabuli]
MLKRNKRMYITISCLLLLCSVWANPVFANEVRDRTEILQDIDEYMNRCMQANHIQAASLAIAKNDEVFYAKGYGTYADEQTVTGGTLFPIASLSKSFTALAVLQLVDKGRITLDTAYASYFPELSPQDPRVLEITVRHLLNQTSGLNDKVNPDMTRTPQFQSLDEVNPLLSKVQLAHTPGTAYSYHNPNYVLLANLVENVSGERFSDYLKKHIFVPLGMNHTFSVSTTQQMDENQTIPQGHYLSLGRAIGQSEPLWFVDGPAGIVSTAEDMSRWMLAQLHGQLVSPALMKQYHAAGAIGPYGMGWLANQNESSGRTISHSGIFWTYKSEEVVYLNEQMGIALMFNSGINAFVNYASFIDGITDIMRGEKPENSFLNGRNLETFMIMLILATLAWGMVAYIRIPRRNKRPKIRTLIRITFGRLIPILFLLSLSPLVTFVGGGRVLPAFGIWTTLSSIVIWLMVWSLVNFVHLACYYYVYIQNTKKHL